MKREHTVINGACRMEECAEHIRVLFADEGYEAQKLRVDDPGIKAMVVQIRNIVSGIKKFTGLDVCVKLEFRVDGNDLHFVVIDEKHFDKYFVRFIICPLAYTAGIGMRNQKELLDRVFMETISFFTTQR